MARAARKARTEVQEMIEVELASTVLLERGREHAATLNALDVMLEDHAKLKKKMKLERENAEEKERDLRKVIETGKQSQPVDCYREADFSKGIATIKRADTGAIVRTEKLGDAERQTDLEERVGGTVAEPSKTGREDHHGNDEDDDKA